MAFWKKLNYSLRYRKNNCDLCIFFMFALSSLAIRNRGKVSLFHPLHIILIFSWNDWTFIKWRWETSSSHYWDASDKVSNEKKHEKGSIGVLQTPWSKWKFCAMLNPEQAKILRQEIKQIKENTKNLILQETKPYSARTHANKKYWYGTV